jgi:hypothetical protein
MWYPSLIYSPHSTSTHTTYHFIQHNMHVVDYWRVHNTRYAYHQLMMIDDRCYLWYKPIIHHKRVSLMYDAWDSCLLNTTEKKYKEAQWLMYAQWWYYSIHDIDPGCISYILSIAAVWYTCHRSMVHVNDWYCILRLLLINAASLP